MMIKVEFVENTIEEGMDEINYVYAVCKCLVIPQALRIRRPDYNRNITFNCPRCSKTLGVWARGRNQL